ncbi:hypothetical protein Tco_0730466 [Tanacetum coccineum]|uniref:Uncharacterized protein n=1 Tax=Tanacetum coccineum TaxID=301880 RepID=A0ABQ4YST7_9ASTR
MTTPRPTPFPATTPRAKVFAPFVIISNSDDEITTLPVRPAPPSPTPTSALYGYRLDSDDDSSDEDLRKEISMPLGYRAAMGRWRAAPSSTFHPLLPSEIPSSSSSPPSLLPSSTSPPTSLLPSTSRKRPTSPSPPLPPSVSPSPLPSPPPPVVPPPPEHIESTGDDIETLRASLASAMQETMTLRARVGLLEQHDVVTRGPPRIARVRITRSQLRAVYAEQEVRELREFWVIDRLEIIELHSRVEYAESYRERSHERQTGDGARRTDMTEQDIETLRTRAETAEQRAETLQVSLGAAQMDVRDLIESREADRTMSTADQGINFAEVERMVAQRVANAIEIILSMRQRPTWLVTTVEVLAKTKDIKLLEYTLSGQATRMSMLGSYPTATYVKCTTLDRALCSAATTSGLVI